MNKSDIELQAILKRVRVKKIRYKYRRKIIIIWDYPERYFLQINLYGWTMNITYPKKDNKLAECIAKFKKEIDEFLDDVPY